MGDDPNVYVNDGGLGTDPNGSVSEDGGLGSDPNMSGVTGVGGLGLDPNMSVSMGDADPKMNGGPV